MVRGAQRGGAVRPHAWRERGEPNNYDSRTDTNKKAHKVAQNKKRRRRGATSNQEGVKEAQINLKTEEKQQLDGAVLYDYCAFI